MDTPIEEAKRYLDNAREILSEKAKKEEGYYQDIKYVKMAGHTAYAGVLKAWTPILGKRVKEGKMWIGTNSVFPVWIKNC